MNQAMRSLLLKAKERDKYLNMIRREGYTLVPLSLYFNKLGIAKLSLGLAKGRKNMISVKLVNNVIGIVKNEKF